MTSSNPTAGGAAVGSGIGPTRITRVIGILKAYTTRVGSGPFPTELHDAMGERLRKVGGEVGVTTGRPRRCGWFDAVIGRYAARVNGITDFFLTKLDVLSGLETVPICVGYEVDGRRVDEMPMTQTDVHHAVPVYEELPGWFEDISALPGVRRAAGERPGVRAAHRGADGRAGVGDRRRARAATRRSPATSDGPVLRRRRAAGVDRAGERRAPAPASASPGPR